MNFLDPPTSLFRPRVMADVLFGTLRSAPNTAPHPSAVRQVPQTAEQG